MNQLFKNKILTWLLVGYGVVQLLSLVLKSHLILIAYELFFLSALVVGVIWVVKRTKSERKLRTCGSTILLFLLINLILFLVYIPALLLNPSINWTLKGESGADPMILLAYLPVIHFAVAFFVLGLTGLLTWMATEKKLN